MSEESVAKMTSKRKNQVNYQTFQTVGTYTVERRSVPFFGEYRVSFESVSRLHVCMYVCMGISVSICSHDQDKWVYM